MPKNRQNPTSLKVSKKPSKKNNLIKNKIIGLVFLIIAVFLLFPLNLPSNKNTQKNPIVISSKLLTNSDTKENPIRILIPKANIDIPVVTAGIVNGYWELSENSASYGLGSGTPGTKSNTVIFAHAREGLFYNLKEVKLNDVIYVFSKNKWFRYKVKKITAVYPNQVDVIEPTKNETLTLYTCTGFNDEKRLVISAIP